LLDLRKKRITGAEAAESLEKARIVVNKNTVPGEIGSPFNPSGIRLGTQALTVRGMKEMEMKLIAGWIDKVISSGGEGKILAKVQELCKRFPILAEK
jgi:glycine hydroxymethyltransferase